MITVHELSKTYKDQTVLNIPHLDIPKGQSFGLVGNNGAGKTTFFSLLLDLIQPSTGHINSHGVVVNTSEDWKKTADRIVFLQKKWKETGSAGQRYENKLWAEFRAACDIFYNARDKHFEHQESELVGNLQQKLALINEINQYVVSEDKTTALNDLKNFNERSGAKHICISRENLVKIENLINF